MRILYQSDDNYAPYMGVSIYSLFVNNQDADEITIYIIDDGISVDNKNKLKDMAVSFGREICFLNVDNILNDANNIKLFSYVGFRKNKHSYLKMFIGDLLENLHGRILYIDCDTVVEGSLKELYECDMNGKIIAMVQDSLICNSKTSIGISNTDRYYNSGIILFDLDKWRNQKCLARLANHISNIRTYGTVDQDVLNVEFHKEIKTLPMKYNVQSIHMATTVDMFFRVCKHKEPFYSYEEVKSAMEYPVVIHFLRFSGEHPWDEDSIHPDIDFYSKYCTESPWKDYPPKKRTQKWIFKVERWMYLHLNRTLFMKVYIGVHERMVRNSNKV